MVATDRKFGNVVAEKSVTAREDRDFTARTFVNGLKPDKHYFYRFVAKDSKSPVGRFKTAPPLNSRKPIRIAFYSCQNWNAGFYNAQRAIANEKDLDLVLCLGDYIYEYSDPASAATPPGSITTATRSCSASTGRSTGSTSPTRDLKAMHAAHPFLSVWDDHEVEDNYADGQPSSHQQDPSKTQLKDLPRRVSFAEREANGHQAFFNYMPRARFKGDRDRIFEEYRLGKLVDSCMTDERQYRDRQPCDDAQLVPCPDAAEPARTMLGTRQLDWFKSRLAGAPHDLEGLGDRADGDGNEGRPRRPGTGRRVGRLRLRAQADPRPHRSTTTSRTWSRSPATSTPSSAAPPTPTGDQTTGRAALPEFVGGSATSTGLPEATGFSPETLSSHRQRRRPPHPVQRLRAATATG